MEVNIEKRHTDNVIFSFDRSRHTGDRQISREYSTYHVKNTERRQFEHTDT